MLADSGGFEVRALATTASEAGRGFSAVDWLRGAGVAVDIDRSRAFGGRRAEIRYRDRGVTYHLVDVGSRGPMEWEGSFGRQFDRTFDETLAKWRPDIVFTYGGTPAEEARRRRAKRSGARVVFGLRNMAYLAGWRAAAVDAILTPNEHVAERYRRDAGLPSTPLPSPLDESDVVADAHEPLMFTYVNPSPEKGVMFFARLAEEVSVRRPDIPFLVIESRGTAGLLAAAGLAGGFDLRRHANVLVSPSVPTPKAIYAGARALLAPSVWEEAAARVVPEALLNGVPPLVSDRGGLPRQCNGAGFVLPIPPECTPGSRTPPPPAAVAPWAELILRLADDEPFRAEASRSALAAGQAYRRSVLAPRYAAFFRDVAAGRV